VLTTAGDDARSRAKTALERHAAFFDPDASGVIGWDETWAGLRSLGVPWRYRVLLTPIINGFLGYLTQRKLTFDIVVAKITDGKHPYDTGVFADDGTIDESAFDEVVRAATHGALTERELRALIVGRGNRRPKMGKVAGVLGKWFSAREVGLLFCLAADTKKKEHGREVPAIRTRTLRRFYDGTLLPTLARRQRISRARRA